MVALIVNERGDVEEVRELQSLFKLAHFKL